MVNMSEHRLNKNEEIIFKTFRNCLMFWLGFLTQHRPPAPMFPMSRKNQEGAERVIQDTRGKNVKNVSGENLSYKDILYNLLENSPKKARALIG